MTYLSGAIISVCFTAVAVGIIETLLPNNSFKNQMRLVTGAVLIISMLSPFLNGVNFDFDEFDISKDIDVSNAIEHSVANAAKNEIQQILEENNINHAKISVETGKDENGSIIIAGASILFDEKDKQISEKAASQIKEKLKIDVKTEVST